MDKGNESVSVILLVYNHGHLIRKVIESILSQSYHNYELIISDDNSTDNSWDIIQEYTIKNSCIKAFKTPTNIGMAANANFAISKAKGDLVALLHHDDELANTLLEKWIKVIKKSGNIAFVFNEYNHVMPINYRFQEIMNGRKFLRKYLLKKWACPVRGTALIRKRYFNEVGGMNEKFGFIADINLWMQLSARWDVGYVNDKLIIDKQDRPKDYPEEYTMFTWKRKLVLFNIHAENINKENYDNLFVYHIKKFIFRNKVSLEIIKWFIYAVVRKKDYIIRSLPTEGYEGEMFYSKIICKLLKN